jgi:hypothetical protein
MWSVRIAVVASMVIAVVAVAVIGDPQSEPWQAKTLELLHNVAAASVGHR